MGLRLSPTLGILFHSSSWSPFTEENKMGSSSKGFGLSWTGQPNLRDEVYIQLTFACVLLFFVFLERVLLLSVRGHSLLI